MDQMQRWLKLSIILVITCVFLLGAVFANREPIVLHFAKSYLAPYEITLTCSDIKLDLNLDLVIDKLCLKHELFDLKLTQGQVEWFYQGGVQVNNIVLNSVNIRGIKPILFSNSGSKEKPLKQFHNVFEKMSQFNLPMSIKVNRLNYQSYNSNNRYNGHFSALNNDYNLELNTQSKINAFTIKFNVVNNEIDAKVTLDAESTLGFLAQHNISLLTGIQNKLKLKGNVRSQFKWKNKVLNVNNHAEKLILESKQGIFGSGPFKLNHTVSWHGVIDENDINLKFEPQSKVNLEYNHETLLNLLKVKKTPNYLIDFLNDNPINKLTFKPSGYLKVNIKKKTIILDSLQLKALSLEEVSFIKLDELSTKFNFEEFNSQFELDSKLNAVSNFTDEAIATNLKGNIKRKSDKLDIELKANSYIGIKAVKSESVFIPYLKLQLEGKVNLEPKVGLHFDLNLETLANKGMLKNIIKTNQVLLNTKVSGSLKDIKITGTFKLDDVNLAHYSVKGDLVSPYVDISIPQLSLPSLLAFNISNKPDIELIDGSLSYQLKGQLKNIQDIFKNDFDLSVNVINVIGEINDIWFEDFNWQQDFTLKNNKIITKSIKKNLSLSSVDLGTPMTNLSASSIIDYTNNKLKVHLIDFNAHAFGGSLSIPDFSWPIEAKKLVTIELNQIDLSKIVELEKQQGIQVTGKVSGQFPIFIGDQITIENGNLYNVGEGIIQIKDNPGVEALKQSSTELALAFDALQNLHYHQLNADVFMYDDGRMLLDTVIKGRNPDLDNEVNLNLNINYDLLGLIKSLRIADSVENEIIQKLQQN